MKKQLTNQEAFFERLIELNITRKDLGHEMQAREDIIEQIHKYGTHGETPPEEVPELLKENEKRYAELEIMYKYLDEHVPAEPYKEAEMKEIKRLIKRDMLSLVENIAQKSHPRHPELDEIAWKLNDLYNEMFAAEEAKEEKYNLEHADDMPF